MSVHEKNRTGTKIRELRGTKVAASIGSRQKKGQKKDLTRERTDKNRMQGVLGKDGEWLKKD